MKGLTYPDGSTIWEDGSKTYLQGPSDPSGTWNYAAAPAGGTPVERADENPGQAPLPLPVQRTPMKPGPIPQVNPGPFPPGPLPPAVALAVTPLPASPTNADIWGRWQGLQREWACLTAWAGSLDALGTAINAPFYPVPPGKVGAPHTAIAGWKSIISSGYANATSFTDLTKGTLDLKDIPTFIQQLNETVVLARAKGYPGCPPAPPPAPAPAPIPSVTATPSPPAAVKRRNPYIIAAVVVGGGAALIAIFSALSSKPTPKQEIRP